MIKEERGLTLIEVMIAMAITVIVVLISFSLLSFGSGTFRRGVPKRNVQQNVRNISTQLTTEVRESQGEMRIYENESDLKGDLGKLKDKLETVNNEREKGLENRVIVLTKSGIEAYKFEYSGIQSYIDGDANPEYRVGGDLDIDYGESYFESVTVGNASGLLKLIVIGKVEDFEYETKNTVSALSGNITSSGITVSGSAIENFSNTTKGSIIFIRNTLLARIRVN